MSERIGEFYKFMPEKNDLMEKVISLCKRRGFIFPGSEIYGGLANSWDYGPLGHQLKQNIKTLWWKFFVTSREDMVPMDTAIIMNPRVWEASGHLQNFSDALVECKVCHKRFRADHLLEAKGIVPRYAKEELQDLDQINCPECAGDLTAPKNFNLMFKTAFGINDATALDVYLRPETAGGMFVNFKNILNVTRKRLPFGIAQVGKCFRNEITPGNFIFRTREFEIGEFEYFIKPGEWEKVFEMWLGEIKRWWQDAMKINMDNLVWHEIPETERAHYSKRTVDIEYKYPFGVKELHGIAYRTDFDLSRHEKVSGQDLHYTDPETNEKFLPHVIEPTFGIDRMLLVALLEAYHEEEVDNEVRVVMKFPKYLAPIQVAVLPLSKKDELSGPAKELAADLRKNFVVDYDETQSIGKRYRRQDEVGTPYCVTMDFDSLEDKKVTVRDRDTMVQERVEIVELTNYLKEKFNF
ncbi:MAG: glycine--tRNA ligase [Candidatus Magasanikbacteria bacterium RIFOXYC2_FULL_42_28]|uniref:Glycine--tRNA ligase n=1 Tax=Candidatus Magasanikbacteria bacterium RIFOXYC2_FULL_42_28 TaxID=1798704 RepID=A0A1F6NUK8_9BACT|nr:MAG: glycine--tRNA ligase [Candidatus Magasanikbacteria bacterium RIFOXYC2_FULL_42_28]